MINLLIALLVLVVFVIVGFWLIDQIGLPETRIVKAILALIALIVIIGMLTGRIPYTLR